MSFSYISYAQILGHFRESGYASNCDWSTPINPKTLFLRHDVDILPEFCPALAQVEENVGFRSSWFFLEGNGLYSLGDSMTLDVIKDLRARGHSIGLHIDAGNHENIYDLEKAIDVSFSTWRDRVKLDCCFSFHRPGIKGLIPPADDFHWHPRYRCTYDGDLFLKCAYISDSNRTRLEVEKLKEIANIGKACQLLTHPIWWSKESLDLEATRRRVEDMTISRCDRVLKGNISAFRN